LPGIDYVANSINKMCDHYNWHENIMSNLIGSIKEMPLGDDELKGVIKKIFKYVLLA